MKKKIFNFILFLFCMSSKYNLCSIQYLLKKWGQTLNERSEDDKRTLKGKEASAIHTQTVSYLKPLFRKLKHKVRYTVSYLKPLFRKLKHKVRYSDRQLPKTSVQKPLKQGEVHRQLAT